MNCKESPIPPPDEKPWWIKPWPKGMCIDPIEPPTPPNPDLWLGEKPVPPAPKPEEPEPPSRDLFDSTLPPVRDSA
jgi:hypothetical protein